MSITRNKSIPTSKYDDKYLKSELFHIIVQKNYIFFWLAVSIGVFCMKCFTVVGMVVRLSSHRQLIL